MYFISWLLLSFTFRHLNSVRHLTWNAHSPFTEMALCPFLNLTGFPNSNRYPSAVSTLSLSVFPSPSPLLRPPLLLPSLLLLLCLYLFLSAESALTHLSKLWALISPWSLSSPLKLWSCLTGVQLGNVSQPSLLLTNLSPLCSRHLSTLFRPPSNQSSWG